MLAKYVLCRVLGRSWNSADLYASFFASFEGSAALTDVSTDAVRETYNNSL